MKKIYITENQKNIIEKAVLFNNTAKYNILNEENRTQKKKCVENRDFEGLEMYVIKMGPINLQIIYALIYINNLELVEIAI